jgi:hypothetical protein
MEIEAKPTPYRGVMFRSKLEATWARFFDAIGVEWEYEPTRLPGWIPDFLVAGWWLAEVKPVRMNGLEMVGYEPFHKAIRPFDTLLLGEGPGDSFGLVVRRGPQGLIVRHLIADISDGEAVFLPSFSAAIPTLCQMSSLWRGVVESLGSWEAAPVRKAVYAARDAYVAGDAA